MVKKNALLKFNCSINSPDSSGKPGEGRCVGLRAVLAADSGNAAPLISAVALLIIGHTSFFLLLKKEMKKIKAANKKVEIVPALFEAANMFLFGQFFANPKN